MPGCWTFKLQELSNFELGRGPEVLQLVDRSSAHGLVPSAPPRDHALVQRPTEEAVRVCVERCNH